MASVPKDLKYSRDHEWVRSMGNGVVRIGITEHAQKELGDIVFVELPDVGKRFEANDVFGTVESVKAVSELYFPVTGVVAAVNGELDSEPEMVNTEPYDDGWMIEITTAKGAETDHLLSAAEYEEYIG